MIEIIKKYYIKILMVIFVLIFCNMCINNCSKSNELRELNQNIELYSSDNVVLVDSIKTLNNTINSLKLELSLKNDQINNLNNTLNNVIKRNTTNNIRVIVPETKNTENKNE